MTRSWSDAVDIVPFGAIVHMTVEGCVGGMVSATTDHGGSVQRYGECK